MSLDVAVPIILAVFFVGVITGWYTSGYKEQHRNCPHEGMEE